MIEIIYNRKKHSVLVKGHAGSAEHGHDLVCSAVSALVYTLASNVEKLADDRKHVRRPVIDLNKGNAVISCDPVHGFTAVTTLVFDTVCEGFSLLAQQYGAFINYKVKG